MRWEEAQVVIILGSFQAEFSDTKKRKSGGAEAFKEFCRKGKKAI